VSLSAAALGKRVFAKEPPQPLSRDSRFFGSARLLPDTVESFQRSLKLIIALDRSGSPQRGFPCAGMTTSL